MGATSVYGRRDIALIRFVFFVQPLILGAWFPRLAEVQRAIGAGEATFAIALTGMSIGIVGSLVFASRLVARYGLKCVFLASFCAFLSSMPLASLAPTVGWLFAALVLVGASLGAVELGMNVTADAIERRCGRLIMSSCHGFWSSGVLVGSLIGSSFAWIGASPAQSLFSLAIAVVLPCLWATWSLPKAAEPDGDNSAKSGGLRLTGPLLAICCFLFGMAMTEGAMADWSAIYLRDVFALGPGPSGFGYVLFALFMAMGRFLGDTMRSRLGAGRTARLCVSVAVGGGILLLIAPHAEIALIGFGLAGLGVSTGFPLAITAAAEQDGANPTSNVALVTQIGIAGFIVGPLLIGFIAEPTGIQLGLAAILPLLGISLAFSGAVRQRSGL